MSSNMSYLDVTQGTGVILPDGLPKVAPCHAIPRIALRVSDRLKEAGLCVSDLLDLRVTGWVLMVSAQRPKADTIAVLDIDITTTQGVRKTRVPMGAVLALYRFGPAGDDDVYLDVRHIDGEVRAVTTPALNTLDGIESDGYLFEYIDAPDAAAMALELLRACAERGIALREDALPPLRATLDFDTKVLKVVWYRPPGRANDVVLGSCLSTVLWDELT